MEELQTQDAAVFPRPSPAPPSPGSSSSSSEPPQSHDAVMPKPSSGSSLRRRPSTNVILQNTIPEEPSLATPPASLTEEGGEEVIPPNLVVLETFPRAAQPQGEMSDEGEEIMPYIRRLAVADEPSQRASRQMPDDRWSTQRTYGVSGTVSMPERRDRLIVGDQNLSVEMQPTGRYLKT